MEKLIENNTATLDSEEVELLNELSQLNLEIEKLDPESMNKQLLEALQKEALNSIAVALDISDFLEKRPEKHSIYHNDVTILKDNKEALDKRKNKYVRSEITGKEFMAGVKRIETAAKKPDGTTIHVDCYTGETLTAGNVNDKYDHEHVIAAKELSESFFTGLFLNEKEIRDFANSDSNLKVTRSGINRSKGDIDLKIWLAKEHPGKPGVTNAEFYNINPDIANKTYKEAHSELRRQVAIKAGERALSMGKQTAINVGGYAIKQTLGELLKIMIVELIAEFKEKCLDPLKERISRVLLNIQKKLSNLWNTFQKSALNNFVVTIMDAILNLFLDTTKKLFKIVRMLWKPILQAIKVIIGPSSEYSFSEKLLSASKIIGAALMGVLGIFLDEVINAALSAIPGVAIVAPYVSPILSALIVGMTSALILQGYDLYKKGKQLVEYKNKKGQIIYKLEQIAENKAYITGYEAHVIQLQTANLFKDNLLLYKQCEDCIEDYENQYIDDSKIIENDIQASIDSSKETNELLKLCKDYE